MNEKNIDYIAASLFLDEAQFVEGKYPSAPASRFYPRSYRDEHGTTYSFGNPKSHKCFVQMTGNPLEVMRSKGITDYEIITSLLKKEATISRLDMAMTQYIDDDLITIEDVKSWWKEGKIESNLTSGGAMFISSFDDENGERPETFYVGEMKKRSKKGLFRAYNKGIQLNIGDYLITRLEYEDRGEKAHKSAERLAQGHDIGSVFRSRFDVKDDRFQALCDAPPIDISRGQGRVKTEAEEKLDNRWAWLMSQVAPAIRNLMYETKDKKEFNEKMTAFLHASGIFENAYKTRNAILNLDEL